MFCTSCGSQNADDAKFCPKCGNPVGQVADAATDVKSTNENPKPSENATCTNTPVSAAKLSKADARAAKPIYKRRWFVITIGVLVVLVILGIIGAVFPNKPPPAHFQAITGKVLPGFSLSNWSVFSAMNHPPELSGAITEEYASSLDRKFDVNIFDFSNASKESKFYENSNNVLENIIGQGELTAMPAGNDGISGQSNELEILWCGLSSYVERGNKCSGSATKPYFQGVMTLIERGSTVTVIEDYGLLVKNAKVAQSVITLLASVGIT
jgi:hypothetical protein